ncbi:hypothetical protein Pla110_36780 [Polystyrenella longa]|uniref:Uncharacterized protein n=1 Tax=Polystyrenella longa TaxID=2528007 RepID=A0A518CRS2_9PLAN|nr:hypothetical protein [Polystyrenella longa]QDU81927.1 hypothetical protein Pla110_36780 [Polystyrenella longa]
MSLDYNPNIDLCCSHCFYEYQINNHNVSAPRLLALQLQMDKLGTELECPRCKGYFLATHPAKPDFANKPHFRLMEQPVTSAVLYR